MLGEEAVEGAQEFRDLAEDAALQPALSLGKKPSPALSQEHEVGVEWKVKRSWYGARAIGGPSDDCARRDFRGSPHDLTRGDFALDRVEEADELLIPMALQVAADHRAVERVERGEGSRRSVTLAIMGHRAGAALFERQL